MRVGLVCPYSLTIPGGVQGQVMGLARSLRRMGIEARVLAPCDGPPPDDSVTPLGNSLPTAANGSVAPLAPDLPAQLRTIAVLRNEHFDVLHLHEPLAPGPTNTAAVLKSAPLVGTFHRAGHSITYEVLGPLVRWVANRLDHRCAVSQDAKELAARQLGGSYELVFNGVEFAAFSGTTIQTMVPTIFFVGRHEPRKGLEHLISALDHLPSHVQLWVGGEGPETAKLKAQTAQDPRVIWLGQISDVEKQARLQSADVLCAPSLFGESFGVVLLEAMAARTPIVASDLGAYAVVARPGRDALLAKPADPVALAADLRRVLFEPDVAQALVNSGWQRARQFSMDTLASRYADIYEDLAARHPVQSAKEYSK
ncbi:MAG: glycosyltransferase family 4 protein [Acidimicrobiia bacterium]|nr:glycosyltransferase family 4 protein [Acidimicrobiia bacterium]MYC57303.1 glycosyltransferase family 4 protein [Acidimicrobiia bacterium]MYG94506.1 glycosyltransferase family 4 protein [Acidimicrobiia bacterium]MYI31004.1 glycosyltransferase family 4 protein [Acidimicrobiia bacterium]